MGQDLESRALDLPEIQSDDVTEIVLDKAQKAYAEIGQPVFVEDVSLVIDAWGKLPGPFIKYFIENVGAVGILRMLGTETNRKVTAICALGCHDGKMVHTFLGKCAGQISLEIQGDNGFGFDPIFVPEGETRSFAEMPLEAKNQISHRARAYAMLRDFLQK